MTQIPLNTGADGTCRTIKANYARMSRANFLRTGGGTEQQPSRLFQVWKSQQNGWVYDPNGIAPCLSVGQHSGVEPKIIVYE